MCPEYEGKLAELLAGELSAGARADVERHLLDCASCRAGFAEAKIAWDAAEAWTAPEPSAALVERTLFRLRREEGGSPVHRTVLGFLRAGTAAAAAVLFAAVVMMTRTESEVRSPKEEVRSAKYEVQSAGNEVRSAKPEDAMFAAYVRPAFGHLSAVDVETRRPVGNLSLPSHHVRVEILDGFARTEIEEIFQNHTGSRLEGTFLFPLPQDASILRLAMEINGSLMEGEVVEREKARQVYEGIVRQRRDPALLEWLPGGLFRCRVFPIEPHSLKRLVLAYTQALPVLDDRLRYVYPLVSDMTDEHPPGDLRIDVVTKFGRKIRSVECPSHRVDLARRSDREIAASLRMSDVRPKNDFVVAVELDPPDRDLEVFAHKVDGEDGYLLCAYTPRGKDEDRKAGRTIFVIDASASMSAADLAVARRFVEHAAPRQEESAVVAHNLTVEILPFGRPGELNSFLYKKVQAEGACDLGAAIDALAGLTDRECTVVYLGEGTPTIGESDPKKLAAKLAGRMITWQSVAIGSDADLGTLEALAKAFGGTVQKIQPSDDVPSRIREVAATLHRPAVELTFSFGNEVYEAAPTKVGTVFSSQRAIVTARYRGNRTTLTVDGREFPLDLPLKEESHSFVKRLWAQRRIADLLPDGETSKAAVVALSTRHQIMTPHTSFLVLETEEEYRRYEISRTKKESDALVLSLRTTPTQPGPDPKNGLVRTVVGLAREPETTDRDLTLEELRQTRTSLERLIHDATPVNQESLHRAFVPQLGEVPILGGYFALPSTVWPAGRTNLELYDARELLWKIQDFPGPDVHLNLVGDSNRLGDELFEEASGRTREMWRQKAYFRGDRIPRFSEETKKVRESEWAKPAIGLDGKFAASEGDPARYVVRELRNDGKVRIDAGSRNGVVQGTRFVLRRDGRYVAIVVVAEVADDHCWAAPIEEVQLRPVEIGDEASVLQGDPAAVMTRDVVMQLLSKRGLDLMRAKMAAEKKAAKP